MRVPVRLFAAFALFLYAALASACASSGESNADADAGEQATEDAAPGKHDAADTGSTGHDGASNDGAMGDSALDAGSHDASADGSALDTGTLDTGTLDSGTHDTGQPDTSVGVITGGPCLSGTAGAAAYRVKFIDAGGQAQVVYEVDGLPDRSRNHAATYGYQIGFTSQFVDPYLGTGGVQLDSSDFIDLEISTVGLASIQNATLSIYGRSFDTTTSGSFNWQTFNGTGSSPTDFVSNVAPYQWYSADFTTEISPGDNGVLVRVKAGPSSGVLVVGRIEICMRAQ